MGPASSTSTTLLLIFILLLLQLVDCDEVPNESLQPDSTEDEPQDAILSVVSGLRFYHDKCYTSGVVSPKAGDNLCVFNGVGMGGGGGFSESASVLEDVAYRQASCASTIAMRSTIPSYVMTIGDITQYNSLEQISSFKAYYMSRLSASPCDNIISYGRNDIFPPSSAFPASPSPNELPENIRLEGQEDDKETNEQVKFIQMFKKNIDLNRKNMVNFDWDAKKRKGSLSYVFSVGSFYVYSLHDNLNLPKRVPLASTKRKIPRVGAITNAKEWLVNALQKSEDNYGNVIVLYDSADLKSICNWDKELAQLVAQKVTCVISTVAASQPSQNKTVGSTSWKIGGKTIPIFVTGTVDEERVTKFYLNAQKNQASVTYYDSTEAEDCYPQK